MKKFKATCIIQARMLSSRLPGKVLLPGPNNKSFLIHLVQRLKKSKNLDNIIIATTTNKIDDLIVKECKKNKVNYFRGDPLNLVDRYYKCAKKFKITNIVRVTSDCPLMDYRLIDNMLNIFKNSKFDFISNLHPPTFPDGFDIEIFTFDSLKKSYLKSKKNYEKEHVTPYIWDNPDLFKIKNFISQDGKNYSSKYRLTLDFIEDYFVLNTIFEKLYKKNKNFSYYDVLKFVKSNKKILTNKFLIKVNWYKDHWKKLKTIKRSDTNLNKI